MSQPKTLTPGGDSTLTIDLNSSGIPEDSILDVSGVDEVSVQASASPWSTAVVTLKRGVDKLTFAALEPPLTLTGPGQTWRLDVREVRYLAFDVTTPEGGASTATLEIGGRRGPPIEDYRLASTPNTGRTGSRNYRVDLESPEWFYLA